VSLTLSSTFPNVPTFPDWPIPELSMFAKPKDSANIYIAFTFSFLSFFTLAIDMIR
jgi:hypothetical protein